MGKALRDLFRDNEDNKIVLPDFQRDLEWKIDKQKKLLSSFIVHLPIGGILLLEGKKEDFPARALGVNNKHVTPKEECLYLLDGQQRLTSLKVFFSDFFILKDDWISIYDDLYKQLRTRWFICVKPPEGEEDFFGFNDLIFEENKILKSEPNYLINFIYYKQIYKTKIKEWYNPGFVKKNGNGVNLTGNKLELIISKSCSEEYLIPLYPLYNKKKGKSLVEKTLDQIAKNRVDEIKAEIADLPEQQRESKLLSYFKYFDDITKTEEGYNLLWTQLSVQWATDIKTFLNSLLDQEIPRITLPKDEIARGIAIFTSINEGGQKLSTYDLIVAKAAKTLDKSLTTHIKDLFVDNLVLKKISFYSKVKWSGSSFKPIIDNKLSDKLKNHYLNMLSIFSHTKYGDFDNSIESKNLKLDHLKARMHLSVDYNQINSNTDISVKAIIRSYAFLQMKCGVLNIDSLSYQLMVIPIAYIFYKDKNWKSLEVWKKIEFWYWSSLFSGYYREAQNDRAIKDTIELYKWINIGNSSNPFSNRAERVFKETNYSDIDTLLLKNIEIPIPKSIQNGILQYVLSKNPQDLVEINNKRQKLKVWEYVHGKVISIKDSNGEYIDDKLTLEDHHIFPLAQATKIGQSSSELRSNKSHILNSPLNRTYISSFSNKEILARDVQVYLSEISTFATLNHFIPDNIATDYINKNQQDANDYYLLILEKRFDLIKANLITHLNSLVD